MEHVVFFSESSGESAFRRVADLEEAVRLVESLRNERGITDVAVHTLTPVPVSFRTYYRVEVAAPAPAEPVPAVEPVSSVEVPAVAEAVAEGPALHLLPPPAVEEQDAGLVVDDREEPEALRAEPVAEESAPERSEAEVEQGGGVSAFSIELAPEDETVAEFEVLAAEASEELADAFADFGSSEPLVPQVRPEPEVEHSLGYFAR